MLTKEADYASRAVLYLSQKYSEKIPVSTVELAEKMDIPYRFLRKIIKTLVDIEIIKSRRGKGGGLTLCRAPEEITLYEVVNGIDSRGLVLNYCLKKGNSCSRSEICTITKEFARVQKIVINELSSVNFKDLCDK
jgi:Rrf2 family protein